jgi:hypothetical protein
MKRLCFYTLAMLLIGASVGAQQPVNSRQPSATATINVRVFFGEGLSNGLDSKTPCSAIKIIATPKNGQPIEQAASGPQSGAKGGQCTASLKHVPANVPIELTASYYFFSSKPDDSYDPPAGKWTNPLTLKAGQTVMKYIKLICLKIPCKA